MTTLELGWIVGILEGEGNFTKDKYACGGVVQISSNDKDVLTKFQKILGVGQVNGPYQYGNHQLKHWQFSLSYSPDIVLLIEMVLPYLGIRRTKQAKKLLVSCKSAEFRNRRKE